MKEAITTRRGTLFSTTAGKRRALPLLLFLILLSPGMAEARLGDSFAKCVDRYGEPVGTIEIPGLVTNGIQFHRGEFSITCGFENNQCVTVVVMHLSPRDPFQQSLTKADLDQFMNDNFGHTSWVYRLLSSREDQWRTYDLEEPKSYIASYSHALKMLTMRVEEG